MARTPCFAPGCVMKSLVKSAFHLHEMDRYLGLGTVIGHKERSRSKNSAPIPRRQRALYFI